MNINGSSEGNLNPEALPPNWLERGDIGTINEELQRVRHRAKTIQEGIVHVEEYEINPMLEAQKEGYKYILRLPRVNESECVKKYGPYYDKMDDYHNFVKTLAKRNGITLIKSLYDSYYVFTEKEDAEKLKSALIEHQTKAELELEIIDIEL